jgi:hypothetical protein
MPVFSPRGFCPSCSAKRSILWGEFVREKVLADCAHRHVAFSIPKMFRIFFLYNRKLLIELSRWAWTAIQYFEVCAPKGTLPAKSASPQRTRTNLPEADLQSVQIPLCYG